MEGMKRTAALDSLPGRYLDRLQQQSEGGIVKVVHVWNETSTSRHWQEGRKNSQRAAWSYTVIHLTTARIVICEVGHTPAKASQSDIGIAITVSRSSINSHPSLTTAALAWKSASILPRPMNWKPSSLNLQAQFQARWQSHSQS